MGKFDNTISKVHNARDLAIVALYSLVKTHEKNRNIGRNAGKSLTFKQRCGSCFSQLQQYLSFSYIRPFINHKISSGEISEMSLRSVRRRFPSHFGSCIKDTFYCLYYSFLATNSTVVRFG